MNGEEHLMRILIWQNGLYSGLLHASLSALNEDIDVEDRNNIVISIKEKLAQPIPTFLS